MAELGCEPAAALTVQEPLEAGNDSQTSAGILLAAPNPSCEAIADVQAGGGSGWAGALMARPSHSLESQTVWKGP